MNLEKLFEAQKELDERIVKEKGLEGQDLLPKKILALQVELGELAQNWRGFKFWSEDQEPVTRTTCRVCNGLGEFHYRVFQGNEHIDDRVEGCTYCEGTGAERFPLLEEYVDCLHFILSIGLDIEETPSTTPISKIAVAFNGNEFVCQFNSIFNVISDFRIMNLKGKKEHFYFIVSGFLGLGEMLGFTWEQIETAYFEKNKINHARQEDGY